MDLTRLKAPVGSLIVDGALVVALVIWGTNATSALANLSDRVAKTEQTIAERSRAIERLSVAESELANVRRNQDEMKADIVRRLERIEAKLDRR